MSSNVTAGPAAMAILVGGYGSRDVTWCVKSRTYVDAEGKQQVYEEGNPPPLRHCLCNRCAALSLWYLGGPALTNARGPKAVSCLWVGWPPASPPKLFWNTCASAFPGGHVLRSSGVLEPRACKRRLYPLVTCTPSRIAGPSLLIKIVIAPNRFAPCGSSETSSKQSMPALTAGGEPGHQETAVLFAFYITLLHSRP